MWICNDDSNFELSSIIFGFLWMIKKELLFDWHNNEYGWQDTDDNEFN